MEFSRRVKATYPATVLKPVDPDSLSPFVSTDYHYEWCIFPYRHNTTPKCYRHNYQTFKQIIFSQKMQQEILVKGVILGNAVYKVQ